MLMILGMAKIQWAVLQSKKAPVKNVNNAPKLKPMIIRVLKVPSTLKLIEC